MSTTLSEAERARRQRFVLDGRTASALGISMQALGPLRAATIKTLTTMIHTARRSERSGSEVERGC